MLFRTYPAKSFRLKRPTRLSQILFSMKICIKKSETPILIDAQAPFISGGGKGDSDMDRERCSGKMGLALMVIGSMGGLKVKEK